MAQAEQTLLGQFDTVANGFNSRNSLLTNKAKQAVNSHAERKLKWLERQLARGGLKTNLENLYRGWSRRVEAEKQSKLEDIQRKADVRSALEIIGAAVMYPDSN